MGFVYYRVRAQAQASQKWSLQKGAANGLQTRVFYQCMWYVLSFLISWPILFAVYLASIDVNGPYGLTLLIAMLAPLQGFNNFCVYVRPKILHWKAVRDKRRKKQQQKMSTQPGFTGHAHLSYPTGGTTTHMSSSFQDSSGLATRRQVLPNNRQESNHSATAHDFSDSSYNNHSRNAFDLEFSDSEHDPAHLVPTAAVSPLETTLAKDCDEDEDGYVDPSVEIVQVNDHADDGNVNEEIRIPDEAEIPRLRSGRSLMIVEEE